MVPDVGGGPFVSLDAGKDGARSKRRTVTAIINQYVCSCRWVKFIGKAVEDERDCLVQVCVEVGRGLLLVERKDQNDACFRNNPYEGDVP